MYQPKEHVKFDPKSASHLAHYVLMRTEGRQSDLRFELEPGFDNVITMMNQVIIQKYLEENTVKKPGQKIGT